MFFKFCCGPENQCYHGGSKAKVRHVVVLHLQRNINAT